MARLVSGLLLGSAYYPECAYLVSPGRRPVLVASNHAIYSKDLGDTTGSLFGEDEIAPDPTVQPKKRSLLKKAQAKAAPAPAAQPTQAPAPAAPEAAPAQAPGSRKSVHDYERAPTLEGIKKKYDETSSAITGRPYTIYTPQGEKVKGVWKLVDAFSITPSHDEVTFFSSEGFPMQGASNANSTDYANSKEAQRLVVDMAGTFDGRALDPGSPIVVTPDGVVLSGNNRAMSSKLAARKGTDTDYLETLNERAFMFGFTEQQVAEFEHPRLVLEVATDDYSSENFYKYNKSDKKQQDPLETAVRLSKTLDPKVLKTLADMVDSADSVLNFTRSLGSTTRLFDYLVKTGVLTQQEVPAYHRPDTGITPAGTSFLKGLIQGALFDEKTIRALDRDGNISNKVMDASKALLENSTLGDANIIPLVQDAAQYVISFLNWYDKETEKRPVKGTPDEKYLQNMDLFDMYASEGDLFEGRDPAYVSRVSALARELYDPRGRAGFTELLKGINDATRSKAEEAQYGGGMFGDEAGSMDDLLDGAFGEANARRAEEKAELKKKIDEDATAPKGKGKKVKSSGGILPVTSRVSVYHGSRHEVNAFSLDKVGEGTGANAYGWGLYFTESPKVAQQYTKTETHLGDNLVRFDYQAGGDSYRVTIDEIQKNGRPIDAKSFLGFYDAMEEAALIAMDDVNEPAKVEFSPGSDFYEYCPPLVRERIPEGTEISITPYKPEAGRVYEADLEIDPADCLAWELSFNDQPRKVKEVFQDVAKELKDGGDDRLVVRDILARSSDVVGSSLYFFAMKEAGSLKGASLWLKEHGIPALWYMLEGARAWVVFDDSLVRNFSPAQAAEGGQRLMFAGTSIRSARFQPLTKEQKTERFPVGSSVKVTPRMVSGFAGFGLISNCVVPYRGKVVSIRSGIYNVEKPDGSTESTDASGLELILGEGEEITSASTRKSTPMFQAILEFANNMPSSPGFSPKDFQAEKLAADHYCYWATLHGSSGKPYTLEFHCSPDDPACDIYLVRDWDNTPVDPEGLVIEDMEDWNMSEVDLVEAWLAKGSARDMAKKEAAEGPQDSLDEDGDEEDEEPVAAPPVKKSAPSAPERDTHYDKKGQGLLFEGARITSRVPVYHGSRHEVNAFSLDKINTGEGNQAYGWGLYFAESPQVAKFYTTAGADKATSYIFIFDANSARFQVTEDGVTEDGQPSSDPRYKLLYKILTYSVLDLYPDGIGHDSRIKVDPLGKFGRSLRKYAELYEVPIDWLPERFGLVVKPNIPSGHIYEVELEVDPDSCLAWDLPASEQPAKVREVFQALSEELASNTDKKFTLSKMVLKKSLESGDTTWSGSSLYEVASRYAGGKKAGSLWLKDHGIPALWYWDAGSRNLDANSEGKTRNWVVFDDTLVRNYKPAQAEEGGQQLMFASANPVMASLMDDYEALRRKWAEEDGREYQPIAYEDTAPVHPGSAMDDFNKLKDKWHKEDMVPSGVADFLRDPLAGFDKVTNLIKNPGTGLDLAVKTVAGVPGAIKDTVNKIKAPGR